MDKTKVERDSFNGEFQQALNSGEASVGFDAIGGWHLSALALLFKEGEQSRLSALSHEQVFSELKADYVD